MKALKAVIILLMVCAATARWSVRRSGERRRYKRSWTYPPLNVVESEGGHFFKRSVIGKVRSDNPQAYSYRLITDPEDASKFSIDNGGELWLEQYVDREQKEIYNLQIEALDRSGVPVESKVDIEVNVVDINDNKPVFDEATLFANVQEDNKGATVFHKVIATDADSSKEGNNVLFYSKVLGSEVPAGNRFIVNSDGGLQVNTASRDPNDKLDAEGAAAQVKFQVTCRDKGNFTVDHKETTVTVIVNILDANDHAPQFVDAPYEITIGELTHKDERFFEFYASDADKGLNSEVTFEITSGNERGLFAVESIPSSSSDSVGKIYIKNELDYESQPHQYELGIKGYNMNATNSNDARYQATTTLTIKVTDENEPPVFTQKVYSGTLMENSLSLDSIGTVRANDFDFGGQKVIYSIENKEDWFTIDDKGSITPTSAIDREHPSVVNGIYPITVKATDEMGATAYAVFEVTVQDENDNAPKPHGGGWEATICSRYEEGKQHLLTVISALDLDSEENGAPFTFELQPNSNFLIESNGTSAFVYNNLDVYDVSKNYTETVYISDRSSKDVETQRRGAYPLVIRACSCDDEYNPTCEVAAIAYTAGASVPIIIGIIIAVVCLLVLILAAMQYQRKKTADLQKQGLLFDEDDVRENLQAYHDEGGGEEDNDIYDMRILTQVDPDNMPTRIDEKPVRAEPQSRPLLPPNSNIEEYIDNAKKMADNDATAPPFDSLLVFDYEGQGSDAGSLSSINSATTDGSQDYDYLNDWGPRFNKIADAYGGEDDSD